MKNLLNNKKYYSRGQLSLKKVLANFLNEEVEKIGDHPVEQNEIDTITVHIGYPPCYNFESIEFTGQREEKLAALEKLKKYYKKAEDENNSSFTDDLNKAFGKIFIARQLILKVDSPDETLTQENLNNALNKQLHKKTGDLAIEYLGDAYRIITLMMGADTTFFTEDDIKLMEPIIYTDFKTGIWKFDGCNEKVAPPVEEETVPVDKPEGISAWYRFPQLNGGFFEMADSLLNSNKMNAIQNTSRSYKQYEKKGTMYGLIDNNAQPDTDNAQKFIDFFKADGWKSYLSVCITSSMTFTQDQLTRIGNILKSFEKRELGRILDQFFKNRMVKVGEYYLIDDIFLMYCLLIVLQKVGLDIQDTNNFGTAYEDYVTNRAPKIIKAKFSPQELPDTESVKNGSVDPTTVSPQKLTIKQMFRGRADKNLANYNSITKNNMAQKDAYKAKVQKPGIGEVRPEPAGTGNAFGDDAQSAAEFENYKKNISRSNRERVYR